MSLAASTREQVRQRAQCACEFCGITEIDAGGMLTIDHFQPRTPGLLTGTLGEAFFVPL
jgi:hypothetical protein